jgi:hypothetical protein
VKRLRGPRTSADAAALEHTLSSLGLFRFVTAEGNRVLSVRLPSGLAKRRLKECAPSEKAYSRASVLVKMLVGGEVVLTEKVRYGFLSNFQ